MVGRRGIPRPIVRRRIPTDRPDLASSVVGGAAQSEETMAVDARGRLVDDPFSWRETKSGEIWISRGGRVVQTLGGAAALRLLKALEKADEPQEQLLLAKSTGNYKRGNER
jgi:hypothetical protein